MKDFSLFISSQGSNLIFKKALRFESSEGLWNVLL